MPEGEWDLIPFAGGKLSLGATHENDMGFDLTVDETLLQQMEEAALPNYPVLAKATSRAERGESVPIPVISRLSLGRCQNCRCLCC